MSLHEELLKIAVVGTERAKFSSSARLELAEIGFHPSGDEAIDFLAVAAVEKRMRRAGYIFLKESEAVFLEIKEPENWQICSPAAARLLAQMLGGMHRSALAEFLETAVFYKKALPSEVLPTIFPLFLEKKLDWPTLGAAIGERGQWLAAQHPTWKNLLEKDAPPLDDWFTASLDERLLFLRNLRKTKAAAARDLVEKVWSEESWEVRAKLVAALETGLSAADEPFLEIAAQDKRKEVRRAAIALLARLEGSHFSKKLFDFAASCLVFQQKTAKIEVFLPENVENEAVELLLGNLSSLKIKSANTTILSEIMTFLPPQKWAEHFQKTPENVVAIFSKSDWAATILPPLFEATSQLPDKNWSLAFLKNWAEQPDRSVWSHASFTAFLANLPIQIFDDEVGKAFSETHFLLESNGPLVAALGQSSHFWSENFTLAFFKHLHFWLGRLSDLAWNGWFLDELLKKMAYRAAPSAAEPIRFLWNEPPRFSPISTQAMDRFCATLEFRQRMKNALSR